MAESGESGIGGVEKILAEHSETSEKRFFCAFSTNGICSAYAEISSPLSSVFDSTGSLSLLRLLLTMLQIAIS